MIDRLFRVILLYMVLTFHAVASVAYSLLQHQRKNILMETHCQLAQTALTVCKTVLTNLN
jgi:hypothetical protein